MDDKIHRQQLRHYDEILAAEDEVLAALRKAASEGLPETEVEERLQAYRNGLKGSKVTLEHSSLLGQMAFIEFSREDEL